MVSLALASTVLIGAARGWNRRADRQELQVVASFYPVYVAAINVAEGAGDVDVINLTQSQTGCLHDFTLRPQDLITLEGASLFLTNGAGMESFLDDVVQSLPSLPVVESSSGISLLHTEPTLHVGDEHEEEDGDNAHIWKMCIRDSGSAIPDAGHSGRAFARRGAERKHSGAGACGVERGRKADRVRGVCRSIYRGTMPDRRRARFLCSDSQP